jgi:hypothetical protein
MSEKYLQKQIIFLHDRAAYVVLFCLNVYVLQGRKVGRQGSGKEQHEGIDLLRFQIGAYDPGGGKLGGGAAVPFKEPGERTGQYRVALHGNYTRW